MSVSLYLQLALVVAAGLAGPVLAGGRRPLAPVLVGELVAGAILGRTGFGVLQVGQEPFPAFYAIGFAMLMLTAGMEVDVASAELRRGVVRGLLALAVSLGLGVPAGLAISGLLHAGSFWMFAVLMAGCSAAVAFPIIAERDLKGSAVSFLIAWIAIADGLVALLLPLTLTGPGRIPKALAGDALMVAVAAAIILVGSRTVDHPRAHGIIHEASRRSKHRHWALQLRVSLLLLLLLGAIASWTGGSMLVAGFTTGIVLRRFHEPKRFTAQLTGLSAGFFVPIFFVVLGADLNLRILASDPRAIAVAVAFAIAGTAVHLIAAAVAARELRVASGLMASAQLGLPAAAASLGLTTHLLTPGVAAALVAGACLTLIPATVGAGIFTRALPAEPSEPDGHEERDGHDGHHGGHRQESEAEAAAVPN